MLRLVSRILVQLNLHFSIDSYHQSQYIYIPPKELQLISSFMYVTYCKLCPLSSIITENVLDVCKPLQVMSFSHDSVNFCG
ncbi:hypothetical protein Hanom_Chr10g00934941 [Helianthus anomalus]